MSTAIQKVLNFIKPMMPKTKTTTYTMKFVYQLSPLGLVTIFYYSYL